MQETTVDSGDLFFYVTRGESFITGREGITTHTCIVFSATLRRYHAASKTSLYPRIAAHSLKSFVPGSEESETGGGHRLRLCDVEKSSLCHCCGLLGIVRLSH